MEQFLVYQLAEQDFALSIYQVERVVRVATITPLAKSHPVCLGLIDVAGTMLPVVDLRALLGLSKKEIELSDMLIICKLEGNERFILLVDNIRNAEFGSAHAAESSALIPLPQMLERMVSIGDQVIPVYNLEKLMEQANLGESLEHQTVS